MSLSNANVQTNLSIHQFVAAAKQFLNDPNLTAKYWSREYCDIIHDLDIKLHKLHFYPEREKDYVNETHSITHENGNVQIEQVFKS